MDIDPASLGQALTRDYNKAQKTFRQAMARQFVLGRQLSEIRQELGEAVFRHWLRTYCPTISPEDAEALMSYSQTSTLARKVDEALCVLDP